MEEDVSCKRAVLDLLAHWEGTLAASGHGCGDPAPIVRLQRHGRCSPQSGSLIELNLAQLSLRADHDWWFRCTWVALFLRPEVTLELHQEEAHSHLPTHCF